MENKRTGVLCTEIKKSRPYGKGRHTIKGVKSRPVKEVLRAGKTGKTDIKLIVFRKMASKYHKLRTE